MPVSLLLRVLPVVVLTLVALAVAVWPPAGLTPATAHALPLVIGAVALWATGLLPEYLTALLFFLVAALFALAPPTVIFAGFSSTAFWLVFSGLVFGAALRHTGLDQRLGGALAALLARHCAGHYGRLIGGVVVAGVLLGFLVPSSLSRAVLLVPIVLAVADRFGFEPGRRGRTGMVLAAAFGCHLPTFAILPANVPNLVLSGAAETQYHYVLSYGSYLWLHFPLLGLLKAGVLIVLIVRLFPDHCPQQLDSPARGMPLSAAERRLLGLLLASLALWMSDFIHHISPAWVGLGAALICLWPGSGLVPKGVVSQLNYGALFFIAGILGLGAVVAHSGLGRLIADGVEHVIAFAPNQPAANFAGLTALGLAVALVTTLPGVPAVLTPLAGRLAELTGWSVEAMLMSQVLAFSTLLLPYQSAPLVVGMQLGGERLGAAVRVTLSSAAITLLLLLPLDYFWWRWLGWI
ncbi:SLC13 family permease [Plasticicumulans acidivorans]|uniref:Di/tricarboxylate transporter n=1 Tax=Plasticicumulans acidivorans TaxID=886464 RepID=A0A317N022_9GAMM|nr:SLC13 family permease [Plasticicumulans acidivorans]PWV65921.1 di/tricarboxylate transporter [Plasticicumulans acidivorans]